MLGGGVLLIEISLLLGKRLALLLEMVLGGSEVGSLVLKGRALAG